MIPKPRPVASSAAAQALRLMLLLIAVTSVLPGCADGQGVGQAAATRKTPADHVLSLIAGKDCSIARSDRGFTTCVEDEIVPQVRVHCYSTLGEATCYAEPDPFPGGQRQLGSAPAVVARSASSHGG